MATLKAMPKPEETWRRARLIPTTGIGGPGEQEARATSSLLAVMSAVPQFGRAILDHVGAPGGRIQTFTEIRFVDEDTKLSIPDGAVVVERGKSRWVGLIEVKTAGAELRADQVERYLDLARVNGFDAVLTISSQITASPLESPLAIDPKKTRKVALRHLSWWQVMTEARVEHKHRGIGDPDQAWILGELIAYLDHADASVAAAALEMAAFAAAALTRNANARPIAQLSSEELAPVAGVARALNPGVALTASQDAAAAHARELATLVGIAVAEDSDAAGAGAGQRLSARVVNRETRWRTRAVDQQRRRGPLRGDVELADMQDVAAFVAGPSRQRSPERMGRRGGEAAQAGGDQGAA